MEGVWKSSCQGSYKKSCDQGPEEGRQEAQPQPQGELLHVRVQGAEAPWRRTRGSLTLTRDWTQAPCIRSAES